MPRPTRSLRARALAALLAFTAVLAGPSIAAASVCWLARDHLPPRVYGP